MKYELCIIMEHTQHSAQEAFYRVTVVSSVQWRSASTQLNSSLWVRQVGVKTGGSVSHPYFFVGIKNDFPNLNSANIG